MNNPTAVSQDLDAYARWTVDIWMGDEDALTERDFTVMGLGLGGEMGEIAEILVHAGNHNGAIDRTQATKEMGDTLYYWARVCAAFHLSALSVAQAAWSVRHPSSSIPATLDELAAGFAQAHDQSLLGCLLASAELTAHLGRVQEIMKKRVRDGHLDPAALAHALGQSIGSWCRLCRAMDLTPSQVAQANHDKIEDRKARGVMRGNGNDR